MDLVKKRTGIELKLFELTSKIVDENGYDLYDLEYIKGSSTLRVFIMDPETKSAIIEDCVKVDKAFTPYCEDPDYSWIPDDFMLEVSSPGVYRVLKTINHFNEAVGSIIAVAVNGKLSDEQLKNLNFGNKNISKLRGNLKVVEDKIIIINVNGVDIELSFDQIKKANLDPDM